MPLTRNAAYNIAERIANVLPLADATVAYQHAALGLSGGRVRPLQSGDTFAGFAGRRVDSRALATGAPPEQVPIIRSGEALLPITASVGASVYATADDTFSTAGGSYIGKVVRLEGSGAWVAFEAQSGGAVPGDGNGSVEYATPPDVVRLTGPAGIKCGAGRLDAIRVESGGSVAIVVYDNPAAASGRQIYSGTLSAGGVALPGAWAVNGMWATISSGAVEFVVSEG